MAWVCTEAVQTQSRELVLGRSLAEFMRALGQSTVVAPPATYTPSSATSCDRLFQRSRPVGL